MTKVIVVSPQDKDIEKAVKKALKDHEVIFVAPSPANFLHLCLGMLPDDPNDGITSAATTEDEDEADIDDEPKEPKEPKDNEDDTEQADDKSTEEVTEGAIQPSEILECTIFDETIPVQFIDEPTSKLSCNIMHEGSMVTYNLNETSVRFHLGNPMFESLNDRLVVSVNNKKSVITVTLIEAEDKSTTLFVGHDLQQLFSK